MSIILAGLNCRIYPKYRRVFSSSCAATDRQHLSSKRELVTEDSKEMFKIARGKFRVVVFLLTETITSNS